MKIEDNHYTYRIETKDSNGGSLDFIDIDTVEPLRCAYDVQDELNLETNEHIKRVEEIVLDANSTEFWYVDEVRTSDTHLVCYFEEVEFMASKDHPMVDTNRSIFEYGKINSNEHQDTNFMCTHVMDNGISRVYMSIDKETFGFLTFNNETIKHFISNNPVTVWYALRYEVVIPRSMSKGYLLTLGGQTDITLTTTSEQAKLPIMKFNIGDTQYTLDTNPIHINNTQEGTQIRNIVLEGNTPINYARGNGVNTTEQVSNTRYDFEPFYDGQITIQETVEGGYVSAKLYGDTMVNIAKPYGETPLLTATNESTLCDDLLGANEEGIVLADGEITEGRIYGDSSVVDNTIQSVVNPTVTWKYEDGTDVYPELETRFTTTCTLNKLPNGVADYIDVVNKVHVQRVGVRDYQETDATDNTVITDTTNTLYELATPIYTPLTEEEVAQLPLSAYADGYVNLSSDQLMPSFEFRMRASNRYQVDMLETGYYYLNAPVGSVKLGTTNVDVQQMPCIIKVDNVGTGDSGYRLVLGGEITDTTQITLSKLPSHRIPTSFTQGMRCGTDFGYWEGVIDSQINQISSNKTNIPINLILRRKDDIADELDIATGKLIRRLNDNRELLTVPSISYLSLSSNNLDTNITETSVTITKDTGYLNPQVKPSHLTYLVPSLVGNRTYTVVHNRKNITGSTKPIELNLGGTVVQLNDASNKTLVKTPSTLAHSNLIFIGGESTVDRIMVLDGDWTNKPIEYFENMMGHDTDAIITIIGNGQINDVAEQYLW